jgi:hypothetical protein
VDGAKAAAQVDPDRVQALVHLEWHLLCSLSKWSELLLAVKVSRGEASLSAGQEVRRLGRQYLTDARDVLRRVRKADTVMTGRSVWARLLSTDGIALGAYRDSEAAHDARNRRAEVQALTAVRAPLPVPVTTSPVRLMLKAASAPTEATEHAAV